MRAALALAILAPACANTARIRNEDYRARVAALEAQIRDKEFWLDHYQGVPKWQEAKAEGVVIRVYEIAGWTRVTISVGRAARVDVGDKYHLSRGEGYVGRITIMSMTRDWSDGWLDSRWVGTVATPRVGDQAWSEYSRGPRRKPLDLDDLTIAQANGRLEARIVELEQELGRIEEVLGDYRRWREGSRGVFVEGSVLSVCISELGVFVEVSIGAEDGVVVGDTYHVRQERLRRGGRWSEIKVIRVSRDTSYARSDGRIPPNVGDRVTRYPLD
jgi:hypothetical protein